MSIAGASGCSGLFYGKVNVNGLFGFDWMSIDDLQLIEGGIQYITGLGHNAIIGKESIEFTGSIE